MLRNNVSTVVLHFFQMVLASSVLALDATETVSQTTTEMIVELIMAQNLQLCSQIVMEKSSNDTLISFKKWYRVKKI